MKIRELADYCKNININYDIEDEYERTLDDRQL